MTDLIFHTASRHDLLVETTDLAATMSLHRDLEAAELIGVRELIPAARTVLIRFDSRLTSANELVRGIRTLDSSAASVAEPRTVTIDVHYDGEDLAEVAELLGTSITEIIRRHQAANWRVAFSGFAPGFGYLAGDDPLFNVPRRPSPRTRVPVGSVALAGEFTGVYPRSSPGGWQLIGRTDAILWDLDREPPALFVPGTIVLFREAGPESVTVISEPVTNSAAPPSTGTSLTVTSPGLQLLIQDLGRPGFASMGVSAAGAADRESATLANHLVGNDEGAAVLESYGGNFTLQASGPGVAALTGALASVHVRGIDGREFHPHLGVPFALDDGDVIHVGAPTAGIRSYLAVRGEFDVETALGSASADTLAHLGPEALSTGQVIAVATPQLAPNLVPSGPYAQVNRVLPRVGETTVLEVTLGPREDWFTESGIETLFAQTWTVTGESDRVGLRLSGEIPLERAVDGELPSEGAVTGALQVPPNGQPVLFGPDHPLTGGYPIIASVNDTDLAAQLPPGALIRFTEKAES